MDKNYNQIPNSNVNENVNSYVDELSYSGSLAQFIKRTYQLLFASMVCATIGAYIGVNYLPIKSFGFLFLFIELGLIFALNYAAKSGAETGNDTLALVLLFAFTLVTGIAIGPMLNLMIQMGKSNAITGAFFTTACAFGGLSFYTFHTKKDFSFLGKPLFFAFIGILIASFINLFFFHSTIIFTVISSIFVVIFCMYIIYDTQQIIKGNYYSPVLAAVNLYLDIYNLFVNLLYLFGIGSNDD